ncbi:MAG: hydantoinase/oxoprolinase family protein [Ardenticatenaceae bacterium]|nr:hydantoinase/oxoprolinase family protein [Ardenticatenaceae bacterium]
MLEIAVDIGGTFTDVVCLWDNETLLATKVPSTPRNLAAGIREGTAKVLRLAGAHPRDVARFIHGTTIATNAILEQRGAVTALLATAGFEDTLEIGRIKRSQMYDLFLDPQTPTFLAPRRRRIGIAERVDAEGNILIALDEEEVRQVVRRLVEGYGVGAIAVCYLFSFRNPAHELRTREIIREEYPELSVALSSQVDPVFQEYERTAVTAFDAYVRPNVVTYLQKLEEELSSLGIRASLQIMQSRGSITSARTSMEKPVTLALSGPAAGVIGGLFAGAQSGFENLITVDIGGTSCDVSLIKDGRPIISREGHISIYPLRVPMVNINTIGAGGGSIVWMDEAGGLRVGPRSAGADPGPACYGLGGENATVTDASLVLGYLNPSYFAAGELTLEPDLAQEAVGEIAARLGLDVVAAARGIHRILNAQMADQIRLVSVRQGYDPRQFAMVVLGGAGPVHGGALIRELGIPTLIVPRSPGVLSAFGLLVANIEHEHTHTFGRRVDRVEIDEMTQVFEQLEALGRERMLQDHVPLDEVEVFRFADMRYAGQAYDLEVPVPTSLPPETLSALAAAFDEKHRQVYGHVDPNGKVEIVNLRAVHVRVLAKPELRQTVAGHLLDDARKGMRPAYFAECGEYVPVPLFERARLPVGARFDGPAIVEQPDTTVVVYPGQACSVDLTGNLIITDRREDAGEI